MWLLDMEMLLMLFTSEPPGRDYGRKLTGKTCAILNSTWEEAVLHARLTRGWSLLQIMDLHADIDSYPLLKIQDEEHHFIAEHAPALHEEAPGLSADDARVAAAALYMPPQGSWLVTHHAQAYRPLRSRGLKLFTLC